MSTVDQVIKYWVSKEKESSGTSNHSIYFYDHQVIYSYGNHFPLAVRIETPYMKNEFFVCNGDKYSVTTTNHQTKLFRELSKSYSIIPFSMLKSAKDSEEIAFNGDIIDFIKNIKIMDRTYDRWMATGRFNRNHEEITEHILGSTLFKIGDKTLLSGIDSGEEKIGPGRMRKGKYFLTLLKDNPKSIDSAFESMKPRSVKKTIAKYSSIKRQGEWFFIPVEFPDCIKLTDMLDNAKPKDRFNKYYIGTSINGRKPHHVASKGMKYKGNEYVIGIVRHIEGDHRQVKLGNEWHRVVRNRQIISWSAGVDKVD